MMKYWLLALLMLNVYNAACQRTIHIEITHTENFVVDDLEVRGDVIPLGDFDMGNWYTDGNTETDEGQTSAINNVIKQKVNDVTNILGEKNNSAVKEAVGSDAVRSYSHHSNITRTSDEKDSKALDNSSNAISDISKENSTQYGDRRNNKWPNDEVNKTDVLDEIPSSINNISFQNSPQSTQTSNITRQAGEKNNCSVQGFAQNSTQYNNLRNITWPNNKKSNSKVSKNSLGSTSDLNQLKSEQIISSTDTPLNVTSYERNHTMRKMLSPSSHRKPLLQVLKSLLRYDKRIPQNEQNKVMDKHVQNQKSKHRANRLWNELFRHKRRINDGTLSLQGKHDESPVNLDGYEVISKKAKNADWKIKLLIAGTLFLILIIFVGITFCFIALVKWCPFWLLCSPCLRRLKDKVSKHRNYQGKSQL